LFDGAIHMERASPFQVERLDWQGRKAFVVPTRADYYTDAIDYTRLKILDNFEEARHGDQLRMPLQLSRLRRADSRIR